MNEALQKRADELIQAGFEVPNVFKVILKGESILAEDLNIRDFVYLPREYRDERAKTGDVYKRAYLLLATDKGIIVVQEGVEELDINMGGYRVRYVPYSKIVAVEIDSVLMQADLRIFSGSGEEVKIEIDFNRKRFFKDVANFVNIVRHSI